MQNIIITLITITISALLVNLLANRLFNVHLKIRPLVLCACCAFLINIVLPRIIMGFVGVIETVGILLIFTIVSAYSIASYNDKFGNPKDPIDTLNQTSLVVQSSTDQQENSCFFEREEATEFIHQEKESEFLEEVLLRDKSEIIMTVAVELPVPTSLVECNTVDTIHIASEQEEQKQIAIPDGNLNDVTVSLEDELSIAEVDLVDEIKTIIESVIPEENPKDITVSLEDESSIAEVDLVDGIKAISESEEQE
ncbi:MAG: Tetratricopeptide 2 repeat-containing protein, partial [Pelosinus sp.]|nr:Tetratricopeptide 2 repeat-containing protein [Pelosinus sp.]